MKLKGDFVTNSSSSSFVVIGTCIDIDEIMNDHILEALREACNRPHLEIDEVKTYPEDFIEYLIKAPLYKDFEVSTAGDPDGSIIIGIPYTKMNDDETLNQFKQRVKVGLTTIFNQDVQVYHIEEAWENR